MYGREGQKIGYIRGRTSKVRSWDSPWKGVFSTYSARNQRNYRNSESDSEWKEREDWSEQQQVDMTDWLVLIRLVLTHWFQFVRVTHIYYYI